MKKSKLFVSSGFRSRFDIQILAYVYILFYTMIMEADMRLSSDVSMC